jgi:hypothetical protein
MLAHATAWFREARYLVSFNGKRFDIPLLAGRYRLAGLANPFRDVGHIDLLHPLRCAFGSLWPDCRLATAERRLLQFIRIDDIPGAMIPQAWFDLVRCRAIEAISRVIEHNRLDLLSLIALIPVLGLIYAQPGHCEADSFSIARRYRRAGESLRALAYLSAAAGRLGENGLLELAALHRSAGAWQNAVTIWQSLARRGCLKALEQLAKYHEHVARDYPSARAATEDLLGLDRLNPAHARRSARLDRKIRNQG